MLGLHVQFATPEAMEYLYRAQPSLVKWMDWDRVYLLKQYCNWYKNKYGIKPTIIARDYEIRFLEVSSAVAWGVVFNVALSLIIKSDVPVAVIIGVVTGLLASGLFTWGKRTEV